MIYPGGKGSSGVFQRLINQIPPHRVYIETHLGGGAVMRNKRPAVTNLGLDADPRVVAMWKGHPYARVLRRDAVEFLSAYPFTGDEVLYADPPYVRNSRRSRRPRYDFEYTEADHVALLDTLLGLPCKVLVSGYWSALYGEHLSHWRTISFETRVRSGHIATEWVWMNYPEPTALHDYRYLGDDFRERARIKKRIDRWQSRLEGLPMLERKALLAALSQP